MNCEAQALGETQASDVDIMQDSLHGWRFVSFVTFHLYMATFQNTFIPPVRHKLLARGQLVQSQARPHRVPPRAPIELVCPEPEADAVGSIGNAQRAKKIRTAVNGQLRKAACAAVATASLHFPYNLLRDWLLLFS